MSRVRACFATLVLCAVIGPGAVVAQVGKSQGLMDVNTITEKELAGLPHMNADAARAVIAKRPFDSVVDLNAVLLEQSLTQAQATEFYDKAFVHINLNSASSEEILLIPGAGRKMAHEFEEYRPWKSWAQFEKEIGKYVGKEEVARLAQYGFIPIDLNSASDEAILSIPGVGQRLLREFKEYRPYQAIEQFEREIGKYVDAREVRRLKRYVTIAAP